MLTPNMSDEELDSVFRRVADEYPEAVPPPGAWEGLEDRLTTALTTQQLRHKVGRALGAEVALVATLLWLGYQLVPLPATPDHRAHISHTLDNHIENRQATSYIGPMPTPAASPLTPTPPASPHQATLAPASAPTRHTAPTRLAFGEAAQPTGGFESSGSASAQLGAYSHAKTEYLAGKAFISHNPFVINHKKKVVVSEKPPGLALANLGEGATPESATPNELALLVGTEPALLVGARGGLPDSLEGVAVLAPADSTQAPQRPVVRPVYRLVVGVLGAPSFSAVRTPQSAQLGADYGLTLEYRFSPRLRVRAGVISSQKRYRAASTDYQAPAAWQWYPGDYMLDANCRVTEIPLDLRFDVLSRPSYTLFGSLGINSLLMRNERYSYDWTMNGQTFTKTAQVLDGSNHFLSVLNVAVGIERPIGGRWALQAEPFWQIPLGEVGAGKVRLSSAGASFSLKFNFLR